MNNFEKLKKWYSSQSDMVKGSIWLGLVLVIGIILRWNYIIERISSSFGYFTK